MRCVICDKEIEKSASDKAIVCEECNLEIEQRLNQKEKVKNVLAESFVNEKKEKNETLNKKEYIKSLPNPIAEKISSHNNVMFISCIIISVLFIILYFIYDFEYIYFLITGLSILGISSFIHCIIDGLAEIINLLDKIYNK